MSNYITVSCTSGEYGVIDTDNNTFTVVLQDFVGSIDVAPNTQLVKLVVHGNCELTKGIGRPADTLFEQTLKHIIVKGTGSLKCPSIRSKCLVIQCFHLECSSLAASTLNISGSYIEYYKGSDIFLIGGNHVRVTDSTLMCQDVECGIFSRYIFLDNIEANISSPQPFNCDYGPVIEHCDNIVDEASLFSCNARVRDTNGLPKVFTASSVNGVIETKIEPFLNEPAKLADENTHYKAEALGYTDKDLVRYINQEGEILEGEVAPRNYDLGIYSLNSYRTTKISTHDEQSEIDERP